MVPLYLFYIKAEDVYRLSRRGVLYLASSSRAQNRRGHVSTLSAVPYLFLNSGSLKGELFAGQFSAKQLVR
jgi:hypothetical protein